MLTFLIFMKLQPFYYCFVFTKTPNMINKKCISAYIDQYPTIKNKPEKIIVVILNISGARAIFLILFVHQDTKYYQQEMYISIDLPIYTHKNPKALWENNFHLLQYGKKNCDIS